MVLWFRYLFILIVVFLGNIFFLAQSWEIRRVMTDPYVFDNDWVEDTIYEENTVAENKVVPQRLTISYPDFAVDELCSSWWLDVSIMQSVLVENSDSMTYCSLTAKENLSMLSHYPIVSHSFMTGFIPQWDAVDLIDLWLKEAILLAINDETHLDATIQSLTTNYRTVLFDIYFYQKQSIRNKEKNRVFHGHRAVLFFWDDAKRYVLDPVMDAANQKAQRLDIYLKKMRDEWDMYLSPLFYPVYSCLNDHKSVDMLFTVRWWLVDTTPLWWVYMRSAPSTSSVVYDIVPTDTVIQIVGHYAGWYQILYDGKILRVNSSYVSVVDDLTTLLPINIYTIATLQYAWKITTDSGRLSILSEIILHDTISFQIDKKTIVRIASGTILSSSLWSNWILELLLSSWTVAGVLKHGSIETRIQWTSQWTSQWNSHAIKNIALENDWLYSLYTK